MRLFDKLTKIINDNNNLIYEKTGYTFTIGHMGYTPSNYSIMREAIAPNIKLGHSGYIVIQNAMTKISLFLDGYLDALNGKGSLSANGFYLMGHSEASYHIQRHNEKMRIATLRQKEENTINQRKGTITLRNQLAETLAMTNDTTFFAANDYLSAIDEVWNEYENLVSQFDDTETLDFHSKYSLTKWVRNAVLNNTEFIIYVFKLNSEVWILDFEPDTIYSDDMNGEE